MEQFKNEFDKNIITNSSLYFSDEKQKAIIERYFKGISIQDLALQFDCSKEIITQILSNKDIEIVDNSLPKIKGKFRFKKKR